ncbi:MAG: glycosyltransferase family 2 protein [Thermoleophilia bacterium]
MSAPRVSVLMPVFNGGRYLADAVTSVLRQTHADLELIAVDDGSTDDTAAVLGRCHDPRVRVVRTEHVGVAAAGNAAIAHARGEYLARHDADDLMAPDRIARQVAYLDAHRSVVACGTDYELFGARAGVVRMPRSAAACRARLAFGTCAAHPTVTIRASALHANGVAYRPGLVAAEDYQLLSDLAEHGEIVNLPFVGCRYRVHPEQISTRRARQVRELTTAIAARNLTRRGAGDVDPASLEPLLWLDRRGARAALAHLTRNGPRLVLLAGRADGAAGVLTALRRLREQANSALRAPRPETTTGKEAPGWIRSEG